ncbi:MAG: hypothetical protein MUE46_17835 [Xanthomonadales bacterium]|jgi:hypothetical protein|nr:hypothetical protein [Xanthomonadales bacterium]
MAGGSYTIQVRPLRFAFLVDLNGDDLMRAIELSTLQWGGCFNPIIPTFPKNSKARPKFGTLRKLDSQQIVDRYLEAFDPDFVVPVGRCKGDNYKVGFRQVLSEAEYVGTDSSVMPNFGIGFLDALFDFIERELKFVRSDGKRLVFPAFVGKHIEFLASIFGLLPSAVERRADIIIPSSLVPHRPKVSIENFAQFLDPIEVSPRRLSLHGLAFRPFRDSVLFICDASKLIDVIDYWNLRAAGHNVVPIPIQSLDSQACLNLAAAIIREQNRDPGAVEKVILQRSRSVTAERLEKFREQLLSTAKQDFGGALLNRDKTFLDWGDGERFWPPYSKEMDFPITEGQERLEARVQSPEIELAVGFPGAPKFANALSFNFHSQKKPMAEVIPGGGREIELAIGSLGFGEWRISDDGPVFLADTRQSSMHLDFPAAESVIKGWLQERGWQVELSPPGRMANRIIEQIGGVWGISLLAREDIIKLLTELEKSEGLAFQSVMEKLKRKGADKVKSTEMILKRLIEIGAILLGVKVQCPTCLRNNWRSIDSIRSLLRCDFCVSDFRFPMHSPKTLTEWTYRATGSFISSSAQGAFTVLFLLRFLSGSYGGSITPMFSYVAKKARESFEVDFTCLYKPAHRATKGYSLVHAECKSFSSLFEEKDFERMKFLAKEFPGCVLIFATLKNSLSRSEVAPLVAN